MNINKEKMFVMFERMLWRIRYVILFPIMFLIIALFYLIFLMGERIIDATRSLAGEDSPFETLVYLIDIVDFTLIAVIILIIIWWVYESFIRNMAVDTEQQGKADLVLIHDIDELKQKLGKVVIISLIVHVFKQALIAHVDTTMDLVWLSVVVILLAISLYLTEKMWSIHSTCANPLHKDRKKGDGTLL